LELQNTAGVTVAGVDASGNGVGGLAHPPTFKNLVINGAMQVAQRNTSVAGITTSDYRTVDRWFFSMSSLGTWTQTAENDAPTGSGFRKSTKVLCTTADASPAAGDYLGFEQRFEGQNLQQIAKGTSSAKELTASFWVKSNVTGTYIVELNDNTRTVNKSYTISSSGTWEKKTITFPADTTVTIDNDNALRFVLLFWLGAGSTFTSGTLQTSWASTVNANRAVGQVNLASATNNYWQITGVQLEVGSTATEFEFKPIDVELAQCQRYYWKGTGSDYNAYGMGHMGGSTTATIVVPVTVTMRANPTAIEYSSLRLGDTATGFAVTNLVNNYPGNCNQWLTATIASGGVQYRPVHLGNNASSSGYLAFSAEL
jgi:hypothetical protein